MEMDVLLIKQRLETRDPGITGCTNEGAVEVGLALWWLGGLPVQVQVYVSFTVQRRIFGSAKNGNGNERRACKLKVDCTMKVF